MSATWAAQQMSQVSPDQLDKSVSCMQKELRELGQPHSKAEIARFLEISAALQRLLLRRKREHDLEEVGRLAVAVLDVVLERFEQLDLRKEILGESY